MTYIKGSTLNEISSASHRVNSGGRNKYSKGHRHYTRGATMKMKTDTIPDDYVQEEPPTNTSLGDALAAALAAKDA